MGNGDHHLFKIMKDNFILKILLDHTSSDLNKTWGAHPKNKMELFMKGGISCSIKVFFNFFLLKNHLE